jgi:peptidoglycan hydrolase-like protein with peptidoglycan-binding domain
MGRAQARDRETRPSDEAAPRSAGSLRSPTDAVLALQATAGNAAVAHLLRQVAAPAASPRHRLIRLGMTGSDVYLAKMKLNAAGADPRLDMSFHFGEDVREAVRRFQTERKLQVDGEVGQQTWAALDRLTSTRTPGDEAEFDKLAARVGEAHERFDKGDLDGASKIYDELYANPHVSVDVRSLITFRRGHIAHARGDFGTALALYMEYLQYQQITAADRRDAQQRLREARLKQPPSPLESDLNKAEIDPSTLPGPGVGGPHRRLRNGDRGEDVYLARLKLNAAGADPPLEMGFSFDASMQNAVRRFQTERELQVDGEIGRQTWAALDTLTAGRTPGSEAEFAELSARITEANERFDRGDLKGAGKLYDQLYSDPRVSPDIRTNVTFRRAHIAQAKGDFDGALSLYMEYLQLPHLDNADRRDAIERIRQSRLKQPPGPLDSALNDAQIDPSTLPAAGEGGPHRLLKLGATGNDVYLARMKLNVAGADPPLEMAFRFDADMQEAVRAFQTKRKLQVDGAIGQQTWAALDLLTSGRSPGDQAEFDDLVAHVTYAHELFEAGDLKKAKTHYEQLYADPHVSMDVRSLITFRLGHIAHADREFTKAISLYTEFLQLHQVTTMDRRDAQERIRQARLKQPPAALDSDLNRQEIDPGTLPAPGP